RAADPRRDARRRDAVHAVGRDRGAVGARGHDRGPVGARQPRLPELRGGNLGPARVGRPAPPRRSLVAKTLKPKPLTSVAEIERAVTAQRADPDSRTGMRQRTSVMTHI